MTGLDKSAEAKIFIAPRAVSAECRATSSGVRMFSWHMFARHFGAIFMRHLSIYLKICEYVNASSYDHAALLR